MIEFTVYGNPVPQGRPRFFRRGNHIGAHDPEKSRSWKETVKWQAIEQKAKIMEGALFMTLTFYLKRPKTLPKKVHQHTKKPDLDNLIKGIKDALRGIVYMDDSQIVRLTVTKEYAIERPLVKITIGKI